MTFIIFGNHAVNTVKITDMRYFSAMERSNGETSTIWTLLIDMKDSQREEQFYTEEECKKRMQEIVDILNKTN